MAHARRSFAAAVAAYAVVLGLMAARLPDRVPVHFGGDGAADAFASRGEAVAFLAVLGVAMAAVMGGLALWAPRIDLALVNLPRPDKAWWAATPEREAELRRRVAVDAWGLGAATFALLVAVELATWRAAGQAEPSLGPAFFVAVAAFVAGILAWSVWALRSRYRTPRDGS